MDPIDAFLNDEDTTKDQYSQSRWMMELTFLFTLILTLMTASICILHILFMEVLNLQFHRTCALVFLFSETFHVFLELQEMQYMINSI